MLVHQRVESFRTLDTVVILRDFCQRLGRWPVPTVPRLSALKATWACLPPCPQRCCQNNQETNQQGSLWKWWIQGFFSPKIPWYIHGIYPWYAPKITTIMFREHMGTWQHDHPLDVGPVLVFMRSHNSVSTGLLLAIFDDFQDGSLNGLVPHENKRLLVYNLSIQKGHMNCSYMFP